MGPAVGAVAGERDRVADQGPVVVASFAHAEAGVAEAGVAKPVAEVGVVVRLGGRGADGALQYLPGGLGKAAAGGLLGFAGERAAARGARCAVRSSGDIGVSPQLASKARASVCIAGMSPRTRGCRPS
ncbi:hypothetical protein [Streptomyces yangpuensis]|uniref:hypothetical protein n=1 Tax=Streptomyces yangpuensis TaxID=1648182 RepID=UPI00364AB2B8